MALQGRLQFASGSSRLEGMQLGPLNLNRASGSEVISMSFPCMHPAAPGGITEERKPALSVCADKVRNV